MRKEKRERKKRKKKKERKNEQLETIRNVGMIRSDDTRDISLLCCVVYTRNRKLSFLILLIILNLSVLTSEKLHDYIVAE